MGGSQLVNKCPTPKVNRHNKPPPRYTLPRIWTARKLEKRRDIFQIVAVEWGGVEGRAVGTPDLCSYEAAVK